MTLEQKVQELLHEFNQKYLKEPFNNKPLSRKAKKWRFSKEIISLVRAETIEECVSVVKENSKGSFTDDAGNDCWYIDSLVERLKALLTTNNS